MSYLNELFCVGILLFLSFGLFAKSFIPTILAACYCEAYIIIEIIVLTEKWKKDSTILVSLIFMGIAIGLLIIFQIRNEIARRKGKIDDLL